MAKRFRPVVRDQPFLMAPDMREWLPAGHLVWFLLDVVAQLDLSVFRARHRLGGVGREAFDPEMLLALLIYGYAVGERSSRQIERLCVTDVAFRVICAQDVPDHSTIARFRKIHVAAFEAVFAQVLALCARAGMVKLATVAIDGTKIAANASIDASHGAGWFRRQAEKIVAEADEVDAAEDALFGEDKRGDEMPSELADPATRVARIRRCLAELAAEEAEQATTDVQAQVKAEQHLARVSEARVSGRAPAGVDPVAVARASLERELVVRKAEIEAYDARVADAQARGTRLPIGRQVRDPLGGKRVKKAQCALVKAETAALARVETKTAVAAKAGSAKATPPRRNLTDPDSRIMATRKGWVQGFNAQLAVSADHVIVVAELTDDPVDTAAMVPMMDTTVAVAGWLNSYRSKPEKVGKALADAGYFSEDNITAPGPDRLIAPGKGHQVHRDAQVSPASGPPPVDATPLEAMRHRIRTPEGATLYRKRGATVEPVNGHLKDRIGLRRFSMRGLKQCQGELALASLTHNLRRLFTVTSAVTVQIT